MLNIYARLVHFCSPRVLLLSDSVLTNCQAKMSTSWRMWRATAFDFDVGRGRKAQAPELSRLRPGAADRGTRPAGEAEPERARPRACGDGQTALGHYSGKSVS